MSRVSDFRERQRVSDFVTVEVKLHKDVVHILNILSKATGVPRVGILSRELSFLESKDFKQYVLRISYEAEKKENIGKSFKSFLGF
ncbi:MAG: hypothetical protein Q8T08_21755 [Ignavibacteria bacterium]|nr:hypothetical protein [Ignavibacteria bacterium]